MRSFLLFSFLVVLAGDAAAQAAAQTTKPRAPTAKPAPRAGRSGVAITVTDAAGMTLPGVTVELTGPTPRTAETDAGGQANFPGLDAGTYRLRFTGSTVTAFEREVTLAAGQIAKLPIRLTPAPAGIAAAAEAPAPTPAAPATLGPGGQPQVLSVVDLVERELIPGNVPRKDALVACSGNTRTMLVQLNEPQAQRVYAGAEALYYVVAGEGAMAIDGRDVPLQAGVYASLPRGTTHALTRKGRRPLILLAVLSGEPCEAAK
jgi:hypothetical protein